MGAPVEPPLEDSLDLRPRSSRAVAIGVTVAIAAVVGVVVWSQRGGETTAEAATSDAGFDYGAATANVEQLRSIVSETPCNKEVALDLGDTLNRAGDFAGAARWVADYEEKCGVWPRLLWVATYAYQQQGDHAKSAAVNSRLIHDRPSDSDFWWWRGQDHADLGHAAQAGADFRQSMAARTNGFAAGRAAKLWTDDAPCEGAFALREFLEKAPDRAGDWVQPKLTELWMIGVCDDVDGRGKARVKLDAGSPLVRTEARIGDHEGTFLVQEEAGLTVVTRAFAETAKLAADGETIELYVGGKIVEGTATTLAEVAIGDAVATAVQGAIVDELPAEIDGVLGASYLWRFQRSRDDKALRLEAR